MMEMTMTTTTAQRPVRTARPRLTARGVLDFLAAADARHRARKSLKELDDHLLRDIGITRADVDAEVGRTVPW
jgi:uncharacterized protein YjiS (DUF1127 family)